MPHRSTAIIGHEKSHLFREEISGCGDIRFRLYDGELGDQLIYAVSIAALLSEFVLHADQAKENDATLIR